MKSLFVCVSLALVCVSPALAADPVKRERPAAPATAEPADATKAGVKSPRDASSGIATGRRQHEPIRLEAKDSKKHFEVTVDAAGLARISAIDGAGGPAGVVPDGRLLLKGDVLITVKGGVVIEGAERIGIAPLPSP